MRLFSTGGGKKRVDLAAGRSSERSAATASRLLETRLPRAVTIFSLLFGLKTLRGRPRVRPSCITIAARSFNPRLFNSSTSPSPSLSLCLSSSLPPASLRNDSVIYAPLVRLPLCFKFMYFDGKRENVREGGERKRDFRVPELAMLAT